MSDTIKYVVITPVRDEERYIDQTIRSMTAQTIRPIEWVIVNDGSTDNTRRKIDEYSHQYPWIKSIHRENRGFRKAGEGVIEAFYDGYNSLISKDWEFIVKLDGDLSFDANYFQQCLDKFSTLPRLGIGGGTIYHIITGEEKREDSPNFHVRGATKIYRRQCWTDIGGLVKAAGWDTLDEVKANMLGWETQSFLDLKVIHHRVTGAADGTWANSCKNGRANYISGYHPLFMILKCLKRSFQKPYIIGSVGLFYGFASGYTQKLPRVDDKDLVDYLRKEQIKRLFLRPSIWK
jgi:glycosyltransferase involved in cell wall biosynthesis